MRIKRLLALILMILSACLLLPVEAAAEEAATPMHRLYNPNSGEHFYTGSLEERENLVKLGWQYEGIAWNAPVKHGNPVYRLYNPNSGDHHYTMRLEERQWLVGLGWQYEGVCWNSDPEKGVALFRLWNPNADLGSHHYTNSEEERKDLTALGWVYEGVGWYGVEEHSHSYTAKVTLPSCTQMGYTTYTCNCGHSYMDEEVPALGHTWGPWKIEWKPTESADGERARSCTVCGERQTEKIPAVQHTHSHQPTVIPPACETAGYTEYRCQCGDTYRAEEVPALGHDWGEWQVTREPTADQEGEKTRTCTMCKDIQTGKIPVVEHTHSYTRTIVPATCTEEGYTKYLCDCGEIYIDQRVQPTGHTWGDWTITREASFYESGVKTRTCSGCAKQETQAVAFVGTQATVFMNMSQAEVIRKVGPLFTKDQERTGILASVSLAQFILESGYGKSGLTQNANNCFGMKKGLSGNTWSGSAWDGVSVYTVETQEFENGEYITVTAEFRKYDSVEASIADHSAYLLGSKKGSGLRYEGLKGCTDYREAITIIKNGGYATDPSYIDKVCSIIERWNLTAYDVGSAQTPPTGGVVFPEVPFRVNVLIDDLNYRQEPSMSGTVLGKTGKGVFTIVEVRDGWGLLKSGIGWIYLENPSYCTILDS